MKPKQEHIKRLLLGIILGFMLLPLLQQYVPFAQLKPLSGDIQQKVKPQFTDTGWWSGSYQHAFDDWHNENFGFRSMAVRIHNQSGYWLLARAYANNVKIGKEGYLYETNYMEAYSGVDFIGEKKIRAQLEKAKAVQDKLAERDITLLLVFAPGKGSFFHEYLPEKYQQVVGPKNSDVYARLSKELQLNHIDAHSWFREMKPVSEYPLFPKCGIHWSRYGALLAADSITGKIGELRGTRVPGLVLRNIHFSNTLDDVDYDIGNGMNLLFGPQAPAMAYADFSFEDSVGKKRPKLLTIADSYFWTFPLYDIEGGSFERIDYLYYNQQYYPHCRGDGLLDSAEVDYRGEIFSHDVIMILCTDGNLPDFSWGFIDKAYDLVVLGKEQTLKKSSPVVKKMMDQIYASPGWIGLLKQKSGVSGIEVDSLVYADALVALKAGSRMSDPKSIYKRAAPEIRTVMERIVRDPGWYPLEIEKSRQMGISIDSLLYLDAQYVIGEEKKRKK
ncbi:MAG: sugar O-acetyltransferase [Bacteroidetes bacterium]|nr:MAG: sugar O-acetyltransferase [Bacteroidota bacterium]